LPDAAAVDNLLAAAGESGYNQRMDEEMKNKKENYITLFEAAKLCSYSEPYLRLRARQGKLKSIKLGKKWMTTADWIGDYEKRVAEWRETSEAKRSVPEAVLVSAPVELSGNIVNEIPAGSSAIKTEEAAVPAYTPKTVLAFIQEDDMPMLPSKTPLAKFATGQILPVPQPSDTETDNNDHFAWFGALVSGALSALILAVAISAGSGMDDLASSAEKFAQANASQAVILGDNVPGAAVGAAGYSETAAEGIKEQFSPARLKEFVAAASRFLNNLDMSGW